MRELAAAFVRYSEELARTHGGESPELSASEPAYEAATALLRDGPMADAWALVLEILRQAPDERLDAYAAGPLEDVVLRWAPGLIDLVEAQAEADERFQWALGCVWILHGELPADVQTRLIRASGGEIKPLDAAAAIRHRERAT